MRGLVAVLDEKGGLGLRLRRVVSMQLPPPLSNFPRNVVSILSSNGQGRRWLGGGAEGADGGADEKGEVSGAEDPVGEGPLPHRLHGNPQAEVQVRLKERKERRGGVRGQGDS